ncbi:MAG: hypothetical protein H0V92_12960 [Pseudonocardiales bacterium]|nr:hypothetical protein [Pseudonocardiales bacterium]
MNKVKIGTSVLAVAAAGSAVLGGVALASGSASGGDGSGGTATNNCLNVGVPILSGIGVLGQGTSSGASCTATANGTGGAAY